MPDEASQAQGAEQQRGVSHIRGCLSGPWGVSESERPRHRSCLTLQREPAYKSQAIWAAHSSLPNAGRHRHHYSGSSILNTKGLLCIYA